MEGAKFKSRKKGVIGIVVAIGVVLLLLTAGVAAGMTLSAIRTGTAETPVAFASGGLSALSCPQGLDPASVGSCIDNWIKSQQASSPLVGFGKSFVLAGQANNINPAFLVAIAGQESSFGTAYKSNANGKANHNYQNMKCAAGQRFSPTTECDGNWAKYPSWDISITKHAEYLKRYYFDKGLNTVKAIQEVYCPTGDGLCGDWVPGVTKMLEGVVASCPNLKAISVFGKGDVVLDPGHGQGGSDGCDRGYIGGTECGNNFLVAQKVKAILESKGVKATLTKQNVDDNPALVARSALANSIGAGVFVSIHSNSGGGSGPIGIVFCNHSGVQENGKPDYANDAACPSNDLTTKSITLSHDIADNIKSAYGFSTASYWGSDLGVLRDPKMPAALIEMFFHDSSGDLAKYNADKDKMSQAIADGILKFMGK